MEFPESGNGMYFNLHSNMNFIKITIILILFNLSSEAQNLPVWGDWKRWGQQADGNYLNPIIPADFSDIDCIKVGNDYYAISSTFQFSPGMTILHSVDLVNWEIYGHAVNDLTQISENLNWTKMNSYGKGIWAGTLRYHSGRFFIFFGTPDDGYFMTSAANARGPWEPLTQILPDKGWDDCSALWDDDGKAYFIGTHFADGYKTYLFNMSTDGKRIERSSARLVNSGDHREANKLLKIRDWYYLIFSEHKAGIGRYVMAKRSKDIQGPFTEERQLALASIDAMEPNQGGIIPGPDNSWYFLTHHGTGDWSGRIASLLPVTWIDGWPIIGKVNDEKIGTMVWEGKMPLIAKKKLRILRSDQFTSSKLASQWQWNYQPRMDMYSLTERPGWLRLKAFKPLSQNDLLKVGNILTQRVFRELENMFIVKMDIRGMADGQVAGICHFSSKYAAAGVVQDGTDKYLVYMTNGKLIRGIKITGSSIWFRSEWDLSGRSKFLYSLNGKQFKQIGEVYQLVWGFYRGDRLGIYCFNNKGDAGQVDIDYLKYPQSPH